MADNITYRFIQNVGDYFPSGYFSDDFITKVQNCAGRSADEMKALCSPYVQIRGEYEEFKNFIINSHARREDEIKHTHDWHTTLLKKLGYDTDHAYEEPYVVKEGTCESPVEIIPVRHIIRSGNQVSVLIMEMQNLITINDVEPDGLFKQQYEDDTTSNHQRYYAGQWRQVIPAEYLDRTRYHFSPAIINKAITQIFLMPEERRPHYILMLAGNMVFLFDHDKWSRGSYLQFSLDDLYFQAQIKTYRTHYALFHLLCCKDTLAADGQTVLMDSLIEESYKNAYEVTKDLKEGVIFAVETLANEALYYWNQHDNIPVSDYTDDTFEAEVKDDCLTIIYRLLFLFYAESREELEILPVGDEVYKLGYSLESLRDLEMMRLNSQASRDGYFFDDSIRHLFSLLSSGHHATDVVNNKSFRVRPIDSPLFNNGNLHHLADVRIRNCKWQEIIKALSLSKKKNYCGRISYANLGVNQLGSVYESLLAFRGFYAEEDYIEVHKANTPQDGTFLVPYSRMGDFDISEVLTDSEGAPVILPKGTFVYRLNGRDRQKSASYYTPEVLTRSTVKYTLKAIIDDVREGKRKALELLDLKILEPAMGAAAFQNEVINQLAEAYLQYRQEEKKREYMERNNLTDEQLDVGSWRIAPDSYRDELQKVKAYIATHNVYGVDLNPTAIELGKLSLWLNVIHKDMETPFFSNRLALGNAVVGAWLKVYRKEDIYGIKGKKSGKQVLLPNKWWEKAPHKVSFQKNSVKRSVNEIYHFLLPDDGMLGVRTIKDYKEKAKEERDKERTDGVTIKPIFSALEGMKSLIADWTKPINDADFRRLQRISSKIDILLYEYFKFQRSVEDLTQNKMALWGVPGNVQTEVFLSEKYEIKQQLNDARYRHDNAYFRLKMVMDYWCSLWFWNLEDAGDLPNREQYWNYIEAVLDVSDEKLDTRTVKAINKATIEEPDLFAMVSEDIVEYNAKPTEQESEIIRMSKETILENVQGEATTFFDNSLRFKIVKRLADRYHFFHPMLEFLEVFWLRDGFDIICGNPPWLKLEFDEQGILSEKYPEVAIRKVSAPDARKMRDKMFEQIPATETLYHSEEIETACSSTFMNAYCNYPLLVGQQTNLYKCVLENGFSLMSDKGFMGLLHPETVYDDSKGQTLRREIYKRLRYHFQYQNELALFAEVHHNTRYGEHIYGACREEADFLSIHNLFHPSTIDTCFVHDGHGLCGGIKDDKGNWNLQAHADRLVNFKGDELKVLSKTFEEDKDWTSVKLTSIHTQKEIKILKKISLFPTHVSDYNQVIITVCHDETGAVKDGVIIRNTRYPRIEHYEVIYNGPQFFISNPLYKTPKKTCKLNSDYDTINLSDIDKDYIGRSNYSPILPINEYKKLIQGFYIGRDNEGRPLHDNWIDHYKLGFRSMVSQEGERSLICAVLPRKTAHIHGVRSVAFRNGTDTVDMAALCSSIVMDFYIKKVGASNLMPSRMQSFPFGIDSIYNKSLRSRTLLLNCLTTAYADLWQEMWDGAYKNETWSKNDSRLKSFAELHEDWAWDIPLRNYYERRQALVEIDVISAMALGLTLQDLEMIYTIQFPVLQQNENDTWYDAEGKIVFTCSKGLTGVGLDRKRNAKTGMLGWEDIRGEQLDTSTGLSTGSTYRGTAPTHTHTIDPAKSELYGGQQQTFVAPYTRCDRIADYRTAWAHFEKIFNK